MFQGWLFHEDVKEEGRLGVSRWPLIGLYDPVNCCAIDTCKIIHWLIKLLDPFTYRLLW